MPQELLRSQLDHFQENGIRKDHASLIIVDNHALVQRLENATDLVKPLLLRRAAHSDPPPGGYRFAFREWLFRCASASSTADFTASSLRLIFPTSIAPWTAAMQKSAIWLASA